MGEISFYDSEERPWPNPRLKTASIVGHTTETTARLWVRVSEEGPYWLVVSENPIEAKDAPRVDGASLRTAGGGDAPLVFAARHDFAFATDSTHVFDIGKLKPGTRYHYAVFHPDRAKPWELGYEERLSFRTTPRQPTRVSFGFFSCHMPYHKRDLVNMDMWEQFRMALTETAADFVIGGGDQVYVDGNKHVSIWEWLRQVKNKDVTQSDMVSWYRDIYRGYWGMNPMRRVLREFPTYMIWDDHEIMDGWGSYTRAELANVLDRWWAFEDTGRNLQLADGMFQAARKVYEEYQHSHNPPTPAGQYDYSFSWGPAEFYVLDMRGHRNYDAADGERILGKAQMGRFKQWLAAAARPGKALFVVSPVPVVHLSSLFVNKGDIGLLGLADDARDEWEHDTNWKERDTLLEALFAASQSAQVPVAFLSGDVHLGASFRLLDARNPDARVYQLTSSGISYAGLHPLARRALKIAVNEDGALRSPDPAGARFHFHRLNIFHRNNFAMIHVDTTTGDPVIGFDLYGASDEDEEAIVRLKRVELKGPRT